MLKLLIFEQFFASVLKTLLKVPPQKIISKFDFYIKNFVTFNLTFFV